ncbi:sigma-70 family RNA polymerase sigma factor [Pelagicoccus sp. SDUM812003]|uniref:RNA polymerase sigma factor n=1 Tax=Pelagicoccus sp. SDUM812003 TaxID=3041267 RepID=UPI0028101116|nr:sigma-70 family RNA polymerase sigma factor [Pelagicoccus sp. SDUM812003]MDQ8205313.1 sigma-70 family RNA polymerase sigma factor [Pelagicoccus sp. SDUM812003]
MAQLHLNALSASRAKDPSPALDVSQLTSAMSKLDEAAYRDFFQNYYRRLRSYLQAVAGGDERHVEDALQISFSKIARNVRRFETESAFWNWLSQICRNTLIDIYRKEGTQIRTRNALEETEEKTNPKPANTPSTRLETLARSLERLPAEDQALVRLKYFDQLTHAEIATQMGTTEKAIESKLSRIRRKLRQLIRKAPNHV